MTSPTVVFVDGFAIRNSLEDDFGIVESHSSHMAISTPKFWIPEGEVWVDHRYRDEADFLIAVDAFTAPTLTESYADRRALAKAKFCTPVVGDTYTIRTEAGDGYLIRYVDGGIVRRSFDPDFVLGGHDLVYDYISQNEIWLDTKMDPLEVPYILLHEVVEWTLMHQGKSYEVAHEFATAADMEARRKNGARYPGDSEYEWHGLSNEEVIQKYYAAA